MASNEWKSTTLGNLLDAGCAVIQTGPFGSQLHSHDYQSVGVPVVPTEAIGRRRLIPREIPRILPEKADELARHILKAGDILFARRGVQATGNSALVEDQHEGWLCGTGAILLRFTSAGIDPTYVSFVLADQVSIDWLKAHAVGAVMPNLNESMLRMFPLGLPPIAAQRRIAGILGAFDDKIELNRRMNETLEGIARAIFKSWFVDFDPVRANAGREPSGLDIPAAGLFPANFEKSALGPIPQAWKVKSLGEMIELAYGKPLKAEDRQNGRVCVYGSNGPIGWHCERLVSGPGVVVGRKGNPGVVTWAQGDFYPIDTTFYVVPVGECRSLYFVYYALTNQNLANLSADSAVPGLNRNQAYMSKQVLPPPHVLEAFDLHISTIFSSIYANEQQSRTLATLRDALLPKLLSGELRVPDAEKIVEEVA